MVEIWKRITELLNASNDCGLCFEFIGAGRADYFNNFKLRTGKECCVYLGLLKFGGRSGFTDQGQGSIKTYDNLTFEVVVGLPSTLDIQFYNENPNIDVAESKYIKYIQPLINCLGDSFVLDCVEFPDMEVSEWSWDVLLNYQDFNIDGIKIKGTFKRYVN
jgi:hypothetical protein